MTKLKNRTINDFGVTEYNEIGLFEKLYAGDDIKNLTVEKTEEVLSFINKLDTHNSQNILSFFDKPDIPREEYFKLCQETWLTPDEFKNIDLLSQLLESCKDQIEQDRIEKEWDIFESIGWIPVLRHLNYMVSLMRKENIVWGVGRGSSVNSYILYKIGIHRVDSLAYGLDIEDFIKPRNNNYK